MLKFSIIIPHKNTPELLVRCLNSIPSRNDLEIIVVDDNSNPDIVDFNNFPKHKFVTTKTVFDKSGRGAGHARNVGLNKACGDWLYFMDSDDVMSTNFVNLLETYSVVENIDMVFLNADIVDENGNYKPLILNRYIDNFVAGKKKSLDVLRFGFWSPWSRLIRRKLFIDNNILFEECPTGNDAMGILLASAKATSFAVESKIMYHYFKPTNGSQTDAKYTDETSLQRLEQRFRINSLYRQVNYSYLWPIKRFISKNKTVKNQAKRILESNGYNRYYDLCVYIRYCIAKFIGRI